MRIFFSAGEPSGDQHAAHLIQELKSRHSNVVPEGFGGPEMKAEGCDLLFELTQLAVMGFLRVVPMLARFRRLVIQAEAHFDAFPPDAVVLIDFPGFNWWIAKAAKKRGIPVYYYMPPQLWGWAPWRVRKVRKWVDRVFCALPFEYNWYQQRKVNATWVGHPFFDEVAAKQLDSSLVAELRSHQAEERVVAVLPGSRDHEIERNFPVMLKSIKRVAKHCPGVRWVVGNYKAEHADVCRALQMEAGLVADVTYYTDRTSEVIEAADCCFMVSGSISLELLARHTPGLVLYRVPTLGRMASKVLMTCEFITLTNLVAQREIMPEFISNGNPAKDIDGMAEVLIEWLTDSEALVQREQDMRALAETAAVTGATQRTAEYLLEELATVTDRQHSGNHAA